MDAEFYLEQVGWAYVVSLPIILTEIVAIILAIVFMGRCRGPAILVLIVSFISLMMPWVYPIVHFIVQANELSGEEAMWTFRGFQMAVNLVHALTWALMLLAVFSGRKKPTPNPHGTPGFQRPPYGPPVATMAGQRGVQGQPYVAAPGSVNQHVPIGPADGAGYSQAPADPMRWRTDQITNPNSDGAIPGMDIQQGGTLEDRPQAGDPSTPNAEQSSDS